MKRAAFTLTELLIAVGIIFFLLALSLPVISQAREKFKAVDCMQRLKNTGAAMSLYIAEGAGSVERKRPQTIYSFLGGSVPGEDTWSNRLIEDGYLQDRRMARCPAVKQTVALTAANWFYEAYGLNLVTQPNLSIGETVSLRGYSGGVFYLPIVRVQEPSRLILLADSRRVDPNALGGEIQSYRLLQGTGGAKTDSMSLRHQGRVNIIFLDGHIEALNKEGLQRIQGNPYAFVPYYDESGAYYSR